MNTQPLIRSNPFWWIVAATLIAFFALGPRTARAQGDCADCDIGSNSNPTNQGTDFLLCFERNFDLYNFPGIDDGYLEIFVGSLTEPATVTITCKHYPSFNRIISLPAHSSDTVIMTTDSSSEDFWILSDETVDDRVVRVTSTKPIVCSGLDYKYETADAVMALPETSSATDYRIMAYQNSINQFASGEFTPSQFAVASFRDNDTITITPSAPTLGGHPAGVPFSVVLQSGECVQVETDSSIPGYDLTGSMVVSTSQIAVYAGNARTEIPGGYDNISNSTSRDLLWEAMPPTSTWGYNFALDAINIDDEGTKRPEGDLFRVLALNNATRLIVNGQAWVTLNANQFADTTIEGPTLVQSSGPLLVGEYAHTATSNTGIGDPFLAIVPPLNQTNNSYTFLLYQDPSFSVNNIIIATDTRSQNNLVMDGVPIPGSLPFEAVPGSVNGATYSILEYGFSSSDPKAQGTHTISTSSPPSYGFTILTYGLGQVVSYGYAGGSLLIPKRAIQIEYPPQAAPGGPHTNTVNFRNTCYMPDYMDSVIFVPTNPKNNVYGIHPEENVGLDIGRLAVGGKAQIHLVANWPLGFPISGTVKIYCHTPAQSNLETAEMPYTLYPDASAGIQPGESVQIEATASPNPFSTYTTLNFSMPETADVSIVLYDELGRVVRSVASGEFPAGPYSVRIDRRGISNGFYTCIISSEKLNFKEHVAIVAGE